MRVKVKLMRFLARLTVELIDELIHRLTTIEPYNGPYTEIKRAKKASE